MHELVGHGHEVFIERGAGEGSSLPDAEYAASKLVLPSASRVLIYSDGLTDAFPMNGDTHQAFGVRGIMQALRTSARFVSASARTSDSSGCCC